MSGSITDSDAGGNDWDDTWTPQQGASYQISNFVWKPLWRKFQIKVHFLDGTTTDHVSACLVPCKMQFFIQHHLQRLQKVIKAIKIIDVESINSSNELLEIKIKSQSQDDIFHQIETAISNESEDIIMKTVLKHAFTEKLLDEICFQQLRETNIDLMSDDTKVCIVGFSEMKEFINKAVTEIDRATVKRVIKWKDKWKMAAALKFKLIETISNTFGNNLIIGNQEEKCSVYIHGREEAVEKARKELDKLISALFVEKIEVNVHLLQLLAFPEASVVFTDILESKHLSVVWVIDEEQISFVSQSELDRSIIRSKIYENFHEVSFVDSVQNQREFVRSKAFIDFTNVYMNKLLLTVNTSTGIIVVSTKAIIHELLHLEKMVYINPSNTKETQVNIADERYIRLKKEYKTLENNLKHVESNWKQETTVRINAEKNLRQSEERWRSEKQGYIDQEKQFKDEQSDLKQEIEQLNYKCKQETIEKEAKEHELVKIRERLTKMENDFQREKQWYIDLEIQLMREQLDSKQEIEKLKYKCKEAIDDNENEEQELLKTRERLAKLDEFKSSYTEPRNNQEDAGTQDMNDITRIMNSPKSGLSVEVQSEEAKKGIGNDPQITAPLDKHKQKDYINEVGRSLGATIRNAKPKSSIAYSTWIRTSRHNKDNLPFDVCKQLDEAFESKVPIAEIQEGNKVFLYDFEKKQYKLQGQNVALGIFFKQGYILVW